MPDQETGVATRFVDLVFTQKTWDKPGAFSEDKTRILFDIVSAAGFSPGKVIPGKLYGNWRDQDGPTRETYPINSLCPFKVVSREEKDDYLATGWLDCALRLVVYGSRENKSREALVKAVAAEIERSIPLTPVPLTPGGDLLCEYPPRALAFGFVYFVEHTRDTGELGYCVGVHAYCNGWMDRHRATATHDAISCRSCHLRVLFPKEVKTYGDLRKALS